MSACLLYTGRVGRDVLFVFSGSPIDIFLRHFACYDTPLDKVSVSQDILPQGSSMNSCRLRILTVPKLYTFFIRLTYLNW